MTLFELPVATEDEAGGRFTAAGPRLANEVTSYGEPRFGRVTASPDPANDEQRLRQSAQIVCIWW